jgi:uncharacterized phage protein (TIGR02220 family)
MAEERDFKGVWIDKGIWLDKRLNALEKVIYTEINSLDKEESGCYASNKYLAEFCQCSETKISTAISKLIELGYIYVKSFDGRIRVLKSRLTKNVRQDLNYLNADIKKVKDINIDNNKSNNNIYSEVLDYLNQKAGTHYRQVESNYKHIKARLQDFSVEELKQVIDKKCKEWIGTEFEKYLTPETLFRPSNFEKYLNQNIKPKDNGKQATKREYTKQELDSLYDDIDSVNI